MTSKLLIMFFIQSFLFSESVALVLKKSGEVNYTSSQNKKTIKDLSLSESLFNQDYIKTGNNGFTKFVYLDDGSAIKLHKDSEIYVKGDIKDRKIIKTIDINFGKMKLDINTQESIEFTVITPTSIASIKGTRFWLNCLGDEGDKFYGLSGKVQIKNSETGEIIDLSPDMTVTSLPNGTLKVEPTTPIELQNLERLEEAVGETTEEQIRETELGQIQNNNRKINSTSIEHVLRIGLKNDSGEERYLIIRYSK